MSLTLLVQGIVLLAALASLGIMVHGAGFSHPIQWLLSLIFGAWVVSPYWYLFKSTLRGEPNVIRDLTLLLLSIGLAYFGLSLYYDGFFVHFDPQNGLLFLIIPFWQWVAVGIVLKILDLLRLS